MLKQSPIFRYTVRGHSMEPTLEPGDKVYVNRLAFLLSKPKIGDVVIVKHPSEDILVVKRIVKEKNIKYFMEGDNKKLSTDSREFGWIEKK